MWETEEYLLHYNRSFSERLESSKKGYSESFFRKCYVQSKNLTSPLLKLKKLLMNYEQIQILDIGGGGGDNYPRLKKIFNDATLHYVILDSKAIWDSSWNVRKRMMIENDLVEHFLDLERDLNVDLVVSIGTISFIPKFNLKLDIVEKSGSPKYIYVDRTFFQIKGKKFTQIAKLESSVNEWNLEVEHFSHNKKELINTFRLQGYSLVSRGLPYPWIIKKKKGKALGYYQELLFTKAK
jgi:putative methyltransferase (TIGR04325 family)